MEGVHSSDLKIRMVFKRISKKGKEPVFVKHLEHANHDARYVLYTIIFNPQFTEEKTEAK